MGEAQRRLPKRACRHSAIHQASARDRTAHCLSKKKHKIPGQHLFGYPLGFYCVADIFDVDTIYFRIFAWADIFINRVLVFLMVSQAHPLQCCIVYTRVAWQAIQ